MKRGKIEDFRPDQEVVWLAGDLYADRREWAAEEEAKRKPTDEMLEEVISSALRHGVDRERVRVVVDEVFRRGGPGDMSELIAALRVRQLWEPSPYRDPPRREGV